MTFSSLTFIFLFLPAALILFFLVPRSLKNLILVLVSLLFYAWGSPKYMILILLSILFHFAAGMEIQSFLEEKNQTMARISVLTGVFVDVFVLCYFKYSSLSFPIGLSFYTFSALSYLLDVYRKRAAAESNLLHVALYICFFPKVTSGPIVQYRDMREQIRDRKITMSGVINGATGFVIGLFKKVLIADNLGAAYASIMKLSSMASATAWLGMIFYSLQLYFDFSGYSDMAIGISSMFGFRFEKNFNYPYMSEGISDFWRRWHISLGAWFREYVYFPLGGSRCSVPLQIRNAMVVWALTGIWHGSTLNFLFWGLYHGVLQMIERYITGEYMKKLPKAVYILITDILVCIGWVFFFSPSLSGAFGYLGKMFGGDHLGIFNATTGFFLRQNLLLLLLAAACSTPFIYRLHIYLAFEKSDIGKYISVAFWIGLCVLCIAGIIGATNTTFLYFQF